MLYINLNVAVGEFLNIQGLKIIYHTFGNYTVFHNVSPYEPLHAESAFAHLGNLYGIISLKNLLRF